MPKRIHLNPDYVEAVKLRLRRDIREELLEGLEKKKVPCHFCTFKTINKYSDLHGHFEAFCPKCGQIAVYDATDYRQVSPCMLASLRSARVRLGRAR